MGTALVYPISNQSANNAASMSANPAASTPQNRLGGP
jgi:hypothetical protein